MAFEIRCFQEALSQPVENRNLTKGQVWSVATSWPWPASTVLDEESGDQNLLLGPFSECVTWDKPLIQSPHLRSGGWVMFTSEALCQEVAGRPGRTPACSEAAAALKVPGSSREPWATCGALHSWED